MILAIDPGANGHGAALIGRDGALLSAAYWEAGDDDIYRSWVIATQPADDPALDAVVELPQAYALPLSKGGVAGHNDLIDVAFAAGWIARAGGAHRHRVTLVRPAAWKGQVPKEVMVCRVVDRLSEDEHARVRLPTRRGLAHNLWDAVGIGLWKVGRLGR